MPRTFKGVREYSPPCCCTSTFSFFLIVLPLTIEERSLKGVKAGADAHKKMQKEWGIGVFIYKPDHRVERQSNKKEEGKSYCQFDA